MCCWDCLIYINYISQFIRSSCVFANEKLIVFQVGRGLSIEMKYPKVGIWYSTYMYVLSYTPVVVGLQTKLLVFTNEVSYKILLDKLCSLNVLWVILENWLSVLSAVSIKATHIYLLSWQLQLRLSAVHVGRWSCLSAHWTYPPPGERRHQPEPGITHARKRTHTRTHTQNHACRHKNTSLCQICQLTKHLTLSCSRTPCTCHSVSIQTRVKQWKRQQVKLAPPSRVYPTIFQATLSALDMTVLIYYFPSVSESQKSKTSEPLRQMWRKCLSMPQKVKTQTASIELHTHLYSLGRHRLLLALFMVLMWWKMTATRKEGWWLDGPKLRRCYSGVTQL